MIRKQHLVLIGTLGTVACHDAITDVREPSHHAAAPPSVHDVVSPDDIIAEPQFRIAVAAESPIRIGQVRLRVDVLAQTAAPSAKIRVMSPDLVASRAANWRPLSRWPATAVTPEVEEEVSLSAGSTWSRVVHLDVLAAGYYSVVVSAVAPVKHVTGKPVQNVAHEVVWIYVDETGGRLTSQLDLDPFTRGFWHRPGPLDRESVGQLRPDYRQIAQPASRETWLSGRAKPHSALNSERPSSQQSAGTKATGDYAQLRVIYTNADSSGIATPVPGVSLYRKVWSEFDGAYIYEGWAGITDENGVVWAECPIDYPPYQYERYDYSVRTVAGSISLAESAEWVSFSLRDNDAWCNGDVEELPMNAMIARLYLNLRIASGASVGLLGYGRPSVDVTLTTSNSHYNTWSDQIAINEGHIWGSFGVFIAAHEFGHALHEKGLGGITGGGCPSAHYMDVASNPSCAYSEGFANFYAIAVMGSRSAYHSMIINADIAALGLSVEGNVAAMMYDIVDSSTAGEGSESFDNTAYGGQYFADLIRTCSVLSASGWKRASRADHLIYCMENLTSVTAPSGYQTDFSGIVSYSENAIEPHGSPPTGWSQVEVRRNWWWNLYRSVL